MITLASDSSSSHQTESLEVLHQPPLQPFFHPGMFEALCPVSEIEELESVFSLNLHQQRSSFWSSFDSVDDDSSGDESQLCYSLVNTGSICGERLERTGRVSERRPLERPSCNSSDPQSKQECETQFSSPQTLKSRCLSTLQSLFERQSTRSPNSSFSEDDFQVSVPNPSEGSVGSQTGLRHSSNKVASARIGKALLRKQQVEITKPSKVRCKKASKKKHQKRASIN